MKSVDGGVVALGVTLLGMTGAGLWKAASLRSDTIGKYRARVDIARAGLDERVATALRRLAEQVNRVLGEDGEFNPLRTIIDPAELHVFVDDVGAALKARHALPNCYQQLLRVGPTLMVLLTGMFVALIVTFSYYTGWNRSRGLGRIGGGVSIVFALAFAVVFVYYAVALHRFSAAEVLASPGDGDD
jgi:hypothetical protein